MVCSRDLVPQCGMQGMPATNMDGRPQGRSLEGSHEFDAANPQGCFVKGVWDSKNLGLIR